jgi:hypothetical protein
MIRVVTGFSPKGYGEYGKRFLDTFHKHWHPDIDLRAYVEEPVLMPRGEAWSLWKCDGVKEFIDHHKDDPEKNGRVPNAKWKERHRRFPYNFRFDAVKFCRQCFIPEHAALDMADGDLLVWLDGDVVTEAAPPKGFLDELIGEHDIVYLGRKGTHSEIGYWSVRLNKRTRMFLHQFAEVWRSDAIFDLPEWHSAYAFDHSRRYIAMYEKNLTPGGGGHVWLQSPLAKYTDHCKGAARKALGHSPEKRK